MRWVTKWHPVAHRLFGPISINGTAIPVRSVDVMLALIRGTTNEPGLRVDPELLDGVIETGRKVSRTLMRWLDLVPSVICPQWTYTLRPRPYLILQAPRASRDRNRGTWRSLFHDEPQL